MLRARQLNEEDGFALLEVIVAAALLAVMIVAVFTTFDVANHVSGQQKARAVAASLAQREQEYLRSLPAYALAQIEDTPPAPKPETVDKVQFTIARSVVRLPRNSETVSCQATAATDYMKVVSRVSAPASVGIKPVTLTSVVTPPAGSFDAKHGNLAVTVLNAAGGRQPNVNVTLSAPGVSTTRVTDAQGCAFFGQQVSGDYTVGLSAVGLVDPNWLSAPTKAVKISPEATSTESIQYDVARTRSFVFQTQRIDATSGAIKNEMVAAKARKIMVAPPGSASTPKAFGGTTPQPKIDATGLFPFTSSYAVYAGDCTGARPADAVALAPRPAVPASALATATGDVAVLMPAVNLTVNDNANQPVSGASIYLTARTAGCSGTFQLGDNATTDAKGRLSTDGAVAAPFGAYDYCVRALDGRTAKGFVANGTNVTDPTHGLDSTSPGGVSKTVKLGTSTGGSCP
jgi:type II secretory pathway pseudopilin PulG